MAIVHLRSCGHWCLQGQRWVGSGESAGSPGMGVPGETTWWAQARFPCPSVLGTGDTGSWAGGPKVEEVSPSSSGCEDKG